MRIAIIGAGLSGRLLALNLCRRASSRTSIFMIDRGDAQTMGPAYSTPVDYFLLNVPCGRMGAFSADPGHFLKWVRQRGVGAGRWDFLPRRLYRDYILDLLQQARRERADGPRFTHVSGEATDIEMQEDGILVRTAGAESFVADKVVLALGNFPPRHPAVKNRAALNCGRYVQNPWQPGALTALSPGDSVLLIGTGQTMTDWTVALYRRAHKGRVVAISRHGVLPFAHGGFEPYPSFFGEIRESRKVAEIFRTVRAHVKQAESTGMDWRTVIDALRPDTQSLWFNLTAAEKRRFLRHVFRYWEICRSRLPPESMAIIERMRAAGQLEIVGGRISDLVDTGTAMDVHYTSREDGLNEIRRVDAVINCIGPETDYERIDETLVKNLLRRGLIRPGPVNLGIDAQSDGAIIGRDSVPAGLLFTLGSPMKGVLWEVLAVPEIRLQAEQLAQSMLDTKSGEA